MSDEQNPFAAPDTDAEAAKADAASKEKALADFLAVDKEDKSGDAEALDAAASVLKKDPSAVDEDDVRAALAAAALAAEERPAPKKKAPKKKKAEPETTDDGEEIIEERWYDLPPEKDDGIKRRWYALHAYSGQEGGVKRNLLVKADLAGIGHLFGGILVPVEEVAEMKSGERKISKRKYFPGYVLVRLPEHPERNAELWHLIKETPGVSGFIGGSRNAPTPLADSEVQAIIEEVRGERPRPKPKVDFDEGERVKIIDGPFANFMGNVDYIDTDRGKLKLVVEIFERPTPVEVEYWQVEKM